MTILEGCYAIVLAAIFVILCALAARNWKDLEVLLTVTLVSFAFRALLAVGRNGLGAIAEKDAGYTALDLFQQLQDLSSGRRMSVQWLDTFMVQTLMNVPGFMMAGATQNIVLLTNCFFGALVAIPAYYYLRRAGIRPAVWGMMLFSFYPAAINFSLFGLRDIVIYTLVATYVLSMLSFTMLNERRPADLVVAALMCIMVLWQRAELIAIMLSVPATIFAYSVWRTSRSERTRAGRAVLLITGATLVVTGMVAGAGIAGRVIASQLGAESLNVATVATVYATNRMERASRNVQSGGESNILPRSAYLKMDPVTRTLLQTGGIIILPYPWLLNSLSRLFAALDSIFLISLLVIAVRYGLRQRRSGIWAPLLSFALGVLMMGLIVSNAGNAFRMRLALVPFVFSVASLSLGRATLNVPAQVVKDA